MNDLVDSVVCITEIRRRHDSVSIRGRIIDVTAKATAEKALIGSSVEVSYAGIMLPYMVLKVGILFRLGLPLDTANLALDEIAEGKSAVLKVQPELIRPMAEPSVRVPLSLLRELRGQEAGMEMSRRALVKAWSEDRRTGKSG